ncbi:hypothetical protein APLC1_4832 [Limnospira platensis C1]|nr:hypothetical protein APLC1_4832 [Arthrospira platensis C1]
MGVVKITSGGRVNYRAIATYMVLIAIAIAMLFPLFWLVGTAFKSPTENIFQVPPSLFLGNLLSGILSEFGKLIPLVAIYLIVPSSPF